MKKSIGILVILAVLCLSGAALAHGGPGRVHRDRPFHGGNFSSPGTPFGQRGDRGEKFGIWRNERSQNLPQTIRAKIDESRKLTDDMRAEMRKEPFNRTRVLQLRERSLRLRRDVSDWLFTQRLDAIEKAIRDRKTTNN